MVVEYTQDGTLIRGYGYYPNATFMTNAVYIKTPAKPNNYTYSYYQNDHLGTPQQLLSFNSATVWQGEYDAFGEIGITNNQIPQPLRFAGQYHDSESNLYYNWHRHYNPKLGRYISSDPIGLDGGNNTYLYVLANPLYYFDPNGLDIMCPGGGRWIRDPSKHGHGRCSDLKQPEPPQCASGMCAVMPPDFGVLKCLKCDNIGLSLCLIVSGGPMSRSCGACAADPSKITCAACISDAVGAAACVFQHCTFSTENCDNCD